MVNPLKDPVTVLKGIGEETAKNLALMDIHTVGDLLTYFPYRFDDYRLRDLTEVDHEERITVEGKIYSEPALMYYGRKKSRLTVRLLVKRDLIKVVFFNQPYLKRKFSLHDTITVSGKWDRHRQTITASAYTIGSRTNKADFEPVYSTRGRLTSKRMKRFMKEAFVKYGTYIKENLPEDLR